MSLVTAAMSYLSRNALHRASVSAVLPEPTGPPMPTRSTDRAGPPASFDSIAMPYCTNPMERIGLAAIAFIALALRVWNLDQNGWGADYYSAAVRSMSSGWHNFLYCAFDPAG